MELAISSQEAIPGLPQLIGSEGTIDPGPDEIAAVEEAVRQHELPLGATMGAGDSIRSLIARIRGRKPVKEFDPCEETITWLECHVPPGGTTSLQLRRSTGASADAGFRIFGSGFGEGRKVSLTEVEESSAREHCAMYRFVLLLQPRIYEVGGHQQTEVSVLETVGVAVDVPVVCPVCGIERGKLDPFRYYIDQYLDLRNDDRPYSRSSELEVEKSRSVHAGFSVPGIPAELSVQVDATTSFMLKVENTFPPGALYQPYRRKTEGPIHTSMWTSQR
jgi:hypothetical protein